MLKSRSKFSSSEEFRDKFLETLTPGVIARKDFISWEKIQAKRIKYSAFFDFFDQLDEVDGPFVTKFADALAAADKPYYYVKTAFELLAHTGRIFVSNEDLFDIEVWGNSTEMPNKDDPEDVAVFREATGDIAAMLADIGLEHILKTELEDYFLGVQVGLETHRRKNVGGKTFVDWVRVELRKIVDEINKGELDLKLTEESRVLYSDGATSKKVDFCIFDANQKIGIEVNFYTATGSKPTEIKRSYGQVGGELSRVNTALVWITDGVGYLNMKKSLKEARDIHPNIYNFKMLRNDFSGDLVEYFRTASLG